MQNYSKGQHQLTPTILNPVDKQSFNSVLRICDANVIRLLKDNINDSEATVAFLEILRDIIDAYLQTDISPLERVRKTICSENLA